MHQERIEHETAFLVIQWEIKFIKEYYETLEVHIAVIMLIQIGLILG